MWAGTTSTTSRGAVRLLGGPIPERKAEVARRDPALQVLNQAHSAISFSPFAAGARKYQRSAVTAPPRRGSVRRGRRWRVDDRACLQWAPADEPKKSRGRTGHGSGAPSRLLVEVTITAAVRGVLATATGYLALARKCAGSLAVAAKPAADDPLGLFFAQGRRLPPPAIGCLFSWHHTAPL